MPSCPYTGKEADCDVAVSLMVSEEAENEALDIFHIMQIELQHQIHRVEVLESILMEHGIDLPEDDDN